MPLSAYIKAALFVALFVFALFGPAGTIAIAGFWVYIAIFVAVIVASFVFLDPDLLRERARPGGQPPPASLRIFTMVMVVHWIVAGLDRGRFLWGAFWGVAVPAWLQALGLLAMAAGFGLAFWAMRVNRFFSSVVRIQSDRGQYVVTGGPYAVIRHPGYLAGIVIIVASGVALGSWLAAAILIAFGLPFLLYRVLTEDRVLQAELAGYRDYAARVRWRILPGIW